MHRLLASLRGSRQLLSQVSQSRFWHWLGGAGAQRSCANPVATIDEPASAPQRQETLGTPPAPPLATSAPRRPALRMRTAPGDIRQAVISGTLGEVCALLEQLALDQEASESLAMPLH